MNGYPKTVHAYGIPYLLTLHGRTGETQLTQDQVTNVAQLIHEGGAVDGTLEQIKQRAENARVFVIAHWNDEEIAGVAALKAPAESYRETLKHRTDVNLPEDKYPVELGYVAISPPHRRRGLAARLMKELMSLPEATEGAFATTKLLGFRDSALPELGFKLRGSYQNADKEVVYLLTKTASTA